MSEMKTILCPGCGKELEIPAELEEFSCLYCGKRSVVRELLPPPVPTPEDFPERYAQIKERLPKTVTRYPDYYKRITKKEFFHAFEVYENENRALFKELDALIPAHPKGAAAAISELCEGLLDDLERHMELDKRWKWKARQSDVRFEIKLVLAIFFCPVLRKMKLDCAEGFCKELHRQWMLRYPKENWEPGDYDVLCAGFKKTKWCYITTATCNAYGKPDDCPELTAFRAFRDGWLTQNGGADLIAEYYDTAPGIVACIDLCDDPAARYAEIRSRWLEPCYRALQEGQPEQCRERYVDMVRRLQARYLQ